MQLEHSFNGYLLLLIWQDLLSFELLDINIVQELECVPNNTPAGKKSSSTSVVLKQ